MTAYIEVKANIRPEDMEKARAMLQAQTDDKIVLLPMSYSLAHPKALFECDRRACETCSMECHLTSDISHAVNFRQTVGGIFEEKRGDKDGPV